MCWEVIKQQNWLLIIYLLDFYNFIQAYQTNELNKFKEWIFVAHFFSFQFISNANTFYHLLYGRIPYQRIVYFEMQQLFEYPSDQIFDKEDKNYTYFKSLKKKQKCIFMFSFQELTKCETN